MSDGCPHSDIYRYGIAREGHGLWKCRSCDDEFVPAFRLNDLQTRFDAVWKRADKLDAMVGKRDGQLNEYASRLDFAVSLLRHCKVDVDDAERYPQLAGVVEKGVPK